MTPFGHKIREFRAKRRLTMKQMATDLGVSSAYLSALEHGKRGNPGPGFILQVCGYFALGWDETEALKSLVRLSNPRAVINTAGLSPEATELANLLALGIRDLDPETVRWLLDELRFKVSI